MEESQIIEWKSNWRDEYLKWICGFANSDGGKLFLGINDNGEIIGLQNIKRLLEDLPNKIQTHLGILCDVKLEKKNDKKFIEINVNPYDIPVSYRGKYYFRTGSTNKLLQGNSLTKFLLEKAGKSWESIIEPEGKFSDINSNAIETFIESANSTKRMPFVNSDYKTESILSNLSLSKNGNLKRAAILLFGKQPTKFYINAYVKIGRFDSSETNLKFQEIVEGNAFQLANKTLEVLDRKFLISPISYEGIHRIEKWEYPYEALREAIINAIIHKDYLGAPIQIGVYNDKLTIWNEGILPDDLDVEDLKIEHSSRPYNPILANTFFKGGLIESWGRGTLKIINECISAGLPEPLIELASGGIKVTLFKHKLTDKYIKELGLTTRQNKIIDFLKKEQSTTNRVCRELFNISEKTAYRDLEKLVKLDILQKVGDKKGTVYVLKLR